MGFGTYNKEHLKGWFVWISKLFLICFIQTILLLLILFFLERTGVFMIRVHNWNDKVIYSGELGGFFFGLILISDILEEILRFYVTERKEKRKTLKYYSYEIRIED